MSGPEDTDTDNDNLVQRSHCDMLKVTKYVSLSLLPFDYLRTGCMLIYLNALQPKMVNGKQGSIILISNYLESGAA